MKARLKQFILLALHACDGVPMPQSALVSSVKLLARPESPTTADVEDALRDVEAGRFANALTDELDQSVTWTLTDRGTHKARQLRR